MFICVFIQRGFLISPFGSNDYFFVIPTACPAGILCKAFGLRRVSKRAFFPGLTQNLLRRDGDSNPGNPFGVYTLSRRASSTTRASLLRASRRFFIIGYKITAFFSYTQVFAHFFRYFIAKSCRALALVSSMTYSTEQL